MKSKMTNQAAFSLVELLLIVMVIVIIAAIAIPHVLRSRMAANEPSASSSGRTINVAQITYAAEHPKIGFACDLTSLGTAGFIDEGLASGKKYGYVFAMVDCKRQNGVVVSYTWAANPLIPGTTGQRFFCGDETGVIRFSLRDATDCLRNGQRLQ